MKVSTFEGGITPETLFVCIHCGKRWYQHTTIDFDLINVCPTNQVRTLNESDRFTP